jgi:hypothetical protein
MRRRGLQVALTTVILALLAIFAPGCLSPTLPLPPPVEPDSIHPSQTAPGYWTISGECDPGALITVFNEKTGKGAVVEDRERTGRYSVLLQADLCDLAWVKQEAGEETSARTTFVIEERSINGPGDPGACP